MSGDVAAVKEVSPGYAPVTAKSSVPDGYKQTELGVIPDNWQVSRLSDVAQISSGTTPARSQSERYFRGGTIPWIKTLDLTNGEIVFTDESVTEEALKNTSLRLHPAGSVVIAMYGGYAQIGRTGYLTFPATTNQALSAILTDPNKINSKYLLYVLNYRIEHWKSVASSSRKDPNITGGDVKAFAFSFPEVEEQRAIATALSDVDALLEALDRLIAKKRDLKQATMQQLLTGQTRLPGFEGEWKRIQIGDIGRTYGGLTGKSKSDFGTGSGLFVPFTNVMENTQVDCQKLEKVRVTERETQNRVMKGDVLFNGSSETPEEVAMCALMTEDIPHLYLNSFCFGLRIGNRNDVNSLYFVYFIRSHEGRKLIQSLAQGSTRYNISKTALLEAEIALPDMEEQAAISQAIKDMETDILILEERRNKTSALKQAMMQELLTGRTRLA